MDTPEAASRRRWLGPALALLVAALAWTPWLDSSAEGYYEAAFKRALITFALARGLNGVISVVQGTELSLQPAGVGVTLAPGEIVDPLNDLIERFSWVMLAASTSLGIQKVLMDISAWWGISLVLGLGALTYLLVRVRGPVRRRWRRAAQRFLLLAVFLRFAMPLMVVLNNAVYDVFLATDYEQSKQVVVETSEALEEISEAETPPRGEPRSWYESLGDWLGEQAATLDLNQRMTAFKEQMAAAIEHLLKLIAVFILQTIVFPLAFLWLLAKAIKNLGRVAWSGA